MLRALLLLTVLSFGLGNPLGLSAEGRTSSGEMVIRLVLRVQKTDKGAKLVVNLEGDDEEASLLSISPIQKPLLSVSTDLPFGKSANNTTVHSAKTHPRPQSDSINYKLPEEPPKLLKNPFFQNQPSSTENTVENASREIRQPPKDPFQQQHPSHSQKTQQIGHSPGSQQSTSSEQIMTVHQILNEQNKNYYGAMSTIQVGKVRQEVLNNNQPEKLETVYQETEPQKISNVNNGPYRLSIPITQEGKKAQNEKQVVFGEPPPKSEASGYQGTNTENEKFVKQKSYNNRPPQIQNNQNPFTKPEYPTPEQSTNRPNIQYRPTTAKFLLKPLTIPPDRIVFDNNGPIDFKISVGGRPTSTTQRIQTNRPSYNGPQISSTYNRPKEQYAPPVLEGLQSSTYNRPDEPYESPVSVPQTKTTTETSVVAEDVSNNETLQNLDATIWEDKTLAGNGFGVLESRCTSYSPELVPDGAGGCTKQVNRQKKKNFQGVYAFRSAPENEIRTEETPPEPDPHLVRVH